MEHTTLDDLHAAGVAVTPNRITRLSELGPDVLAKVGHLLRSAENPAGADADAELPVPTGHFVLCLQYIRPAKVGSIILAQQTLKEDSYQGRVGVVLALGPDAYPASDGRFAGGPWCKVGDFVAWPALENASGRFPWDSASLICLPDDRVILNSCDPLHMVGR